MNDFFTPGFRSSEDHLARAKRFHRCTLNQAQERWDSFASALAIAGARRRVKMMLSPDYSMHIAMRQRDVQAFFNNAARDRRRVTSGNSTACRIQPRISALEC